MTRVVCSMPCFQAISQRERKIDTLFYTIIIYSRSFLDIALLGGGGGGGGRLHTSLKYGRLTFCGVGHVPVGI